MKNKPIYNFKIQKFKDNNNRIIEEQLKKRLIEIDKKITQTIKDLVNSQLLQIRVVLTSKNNLIDKIQRSIYESPINNSIRWHKHILSELYKERKETQIRYEKITGTYWVNRIKSLFVKLLFFGFIVLSLGVFISGIMAIIYLLPIILTISIIYLFLQYKRKF